jgi:hypothetical protein
MSHNTLKLFNWGKDKDGDYIGSLGALMIGDDPNKPLIGLWNDIDSAISIGYQDRTDPHSIPSYVEFDYYNILDRNRYPINFYTDTRFERYLYLNMALRGTGKTIVLEGDYLWFTPEGGGGAHMSVDNNGNAHFAGKITCNALDVMSVDKHRVIETSQGKVGVNSLETPEVMNEDVGRGQLNGNGECLISIESLFGECIETDEYDVFLTKYGKGDIWVQEMNLDSFLVCGEPNLKFSWRLIAVQKGCKGIRLKKIED